jgi:hypothetical protein
VKVTGAQGLTGRQEAIFLQKIENELGFTQDIIAAELPDYAVNAGMRGICINKGRFDHMFEPVEWLAFAVDG